MAIGFTTLGDHVSRAATFWSPAGSWTKFLYGNFHVAPVGAGSTVWLAGDQAYAGAYIWLGSDATLTDWYIGVSDTAGNFAFSPAGAATPVPVATWGWVAGVFDAGAQTLSLYQGTKGAGALIATVSTVGVDMASLAPFAVERMGSDAGGSDPGIVVEYERFWQAPLSLPSLIAESASTTPVVATALLSGSRLAWKTDVTDQSSGHNWTFTGTGSYIDGPLPPANLTALTAAVIASLPYSATQDVQDAPTSHQVWYQYTAPADGVITFWGYGDATVYRPQVAVYLAPGTITRYLGLLAGAAAGKLTNPLQFPVLSGETYLFKFIGNAAALTPTIVTITAVTFMANSVPAESIAINDDAGLIARGDGTFDTFPLALLSTTADYSPLRYIPSFPSGETGDALADGTSLVGTDDEPTLRLVGYDHAFTQLFSNAFSATTLKNIWANRGLGKFYVLFYDAVAPKFAKVSRVAADGTIEATTSAIVASTASAICIATSPDGTILYFCNQASPGQIRRWDLVNDIALADLVSGLVGVQFGRNMVCLGDGSVVIVDTAHQEIRRYSSAGALLNTYTAASLGIPSFGSSADARIAQGVTNTNFWYRNIDTDASGAFYGFFLKIDAATGTVLVNRKNVIYSAGEFFGDYATPGALQAMAGFSESCTFWSLPVGISGGVGTLIVQKVVSPAGTLDTFDFTAVGVGLPAAFALVGGGQQEFDLVDTNIPHSIIEAPATGYATSYVTSNGSPHTAIVIADGETVTLVVTNRYMPPTVVGRLRRYRRFQIKFLRNRSIFLHKIEFLIQPGVGRTNGQGEQPEALFRLSVDGGRTWGPQIVLSWGARGDYQHRMFLNNPGFGRDLYGEISWTDPIFGALIDCLIDYTVGNE